MIAFSEQLRSTKFRHIMKFLFSLLPLEFVMEKIWELEQLTHYSD
jgi:hypothetical protein